MFKNKKHKTFNYKPRFSKESQSNASLNVNAQNTESFTSKWRLSRGGKTKTRSAMPMRTLILVLVLLLICMYLLEKKYM